MTSVTLLIAWLYPIIKWLPWTMVSAVFKAEGDDLNIWTFFFESYSTHCQEWFPVVPVSENYMAAFRQHLTLHWDYQGCLKQWDWNFHRDFGGVGVWCLFLHRRKIALNPCYRKCYWCGPGWNNFPTSLILRNWLTKISHLYLTQLQVIVEDTKLLPNY